MRLNPFTDKIDINLSDFNDNTLNIEIIDLYGNVLSSKELSAKSCTLTLYLDNLPPAIYILKIKTSSGFVYKRIEKI